MRHAPASFRASPAPPPCCATHPEGPRQRIIPAGAPWMSPFSFRWTRAALEIERDPGLPNLQDLEQRGKNERAPELHAPVTPSVDAIPTHRLQPRSPTCGRGPGQPPIRAVTSIRVFFSEHRIMENTKIRLLTPAGSPPRPNHPAESGAKVPRRRGKSAHSRASTSKTVRRQSHPQKRMPDGTKTTKRAWCQQVRAEATRFPRPPASLGRRANEGRSAPASTSRRKTSDSVAS